jgi:hypothetical protein
MGRSEKKLASRILRAVRGCNEAKTSVMLHTFGHDLRHGGLEAQSTAQCDFCVAVTVFGSALGVREASQTICIGADD